MNAVSLFAGVAGFDLALNNAGIPVVATVEIDKHARGVLQYRFPDVQHFEDIRKVSGDDLRGAGFIPDTGIIVGGFPCQDVSIAGRRAGFDGERSVLFYEFVRLIEETQSEWALFENVPGLLSSRGGRDMGAVIGTLAELGYGVAWRVLDSQYQGVAQRRRRVFILARRAGDATSCAQVLFEREGVRGDNPQERTEGKETSAGTIVGTITSRTNLSVGTQDAAAGHFIVAPLANTLRSGGDGNVPSSRGENLIAFSHTQGLDVQASQDNFPTLRANGGGHAIAETIYTPNRSDGFRSYEGIAPTLTSFMGTGGNNVPFVKVIRSGARDENGNLPPEVWAERDVAPTLNQFDQSGESRTPILLTMRAGKEGGGKGALISEDQSLTIATGNGQTLTYEGVRRLTPKETERLQGFPDDWTKYRLDNGDVVEQADSSRYKQMGNAVTVNAVSWIAQRLATLAGIDPKEGE